MKNKVDRLSDILRLIQLLGQDKTKQHASETLDKSFGKPYSADTWETIAEEHKEFFYLGTGKTKEIGLNSRRCKDDPLSKEEIDKLIDRAIKIYDRHFEYSRWWTFLIPVVSAFIGGIVVKFL